MDGFWWILGRASQRVIHKSWRKNLKLISHEYFQRNFFGEFFDNFFCYWKMSLGPTLFCFEILWSLRESSYERSCRSFEISKFFIFIFFCCWLLALFLNFAIFYQEQGPEIFMLIEIFFKSDQFFFQICFLVLFHCLLIGKCQTIGFDS